MRQRGTALCSGDELDYNSVRHVRVTSVTAWVLLPQPCPVQWGHPHGLTSSYIHTQCPAEARQHVTAERIQSMQDIDIKLLKCPTFYERSGNFLPSARDDRLSVTEIASL